MKISKSERIDKIKSLLTVEEGKIFEAFHQDQIRDTVKYEYLKEKWECICRDIKDNYLITEPNSKIAFDIVVRVHYYTKETYGDENKDIQLMYWKIFKSNDDKVVSLVGMNCEMVSWLEKATEKFWGHMITLYDSEIGR